MRFAFVRMLGKDRFDSNTADKNVGLGYLSTIAESKGVETHLFDPLDSTETTFSRLNCPIFTQKYDLVGFTVHCLNILESLDAAKKIKRAHQSTIIIFGGHHASATANEILKDHEYVDAICVGEGENVIVQIIQLLKKGNAIKRIRNQGIFNGKCFDLDKLPMPRMQNISSVERISTSRGCPYSCTFCTTPAIRRLAKEPVYRSRSPSNVIEEIEALYSHGTKKIYINDDLFITNNTDSHNRAIRIAKLLLEREIDIEYKAQLRIDSFSIQDYDKIIFLRNSGLKSVFIGVESGSNEILDEYNKRLNLNQCIDMLQMYHKAGIQVNAGNILASPNSTLKSISESIRGFSQMGLSYLFFRRITFRAHVFPGTPIEKRLICENRLENKPRYLPRSYRFSDSRINTLVNMFESMMPYFLQEIGSDLFHLRSIALKLMYDQQKRSVESKLTKILDRWNNISTHFLLDWFGYSRPLNQTEFEKNFHEYIEACQVIRKQLGDFINNSNNLT